MLSHVRGALAPQLRLSYRYTGFRACTLFAFDEGRYHDYFHPAFSYSSFRPGRRAVAVWRDAVDWAGLARRFWSSGLTTWDKSPLYKELHQPTHLRWNSFNIGPEVACFLETSDARGPRGGNIGKEYLSWVVGKKQKLVIND